MTGYPSIKALRHLRTGLKRLWRNTLTAGYRPPGGWSPPPVLIVLRPTERCNLNCRTCYERGEGVVRGAWPEGGAGAGPEMSASRYAALIGELAGFEPTFYITGGEPLLADTLAPIIRAITGRGLYVSLNTNGVLLEARAEELIDSGLDKVIVSIDGPREVHDRIRGQTFDAIARGIAALNRLKQARRSATPALRIQCVISRHNIGSLAELAAEAGRMGVAELRFQHPMFVFSEKACGVDSFLRALAGRIQIARPLMPPGALNGEDICAQLSRLGKRRAGLPRVSCEPAIALREIHGYYHDPDYPFPNLCLSPWRRLDISASGEMGPCQGSYLARYPETTPRDAWQGEAFRAFRRHVAERGLFSHCQRCCHREYHAPGMLRLAVN